MRDTKYILFPYFIMGKTSLLTDTLYVIGNRDPYPIQGALSLQESPRQTQSVQPFLHSAAA